MRRAPLDGDDFIGGNAVFSQGLIRIYKGHLGAMFVEGRMIIHNLCHILKSNSNHRHATMFHTWVLTVSGCVQT